MDIGEIKKSDTLVIRIRKIEYRGKTYIDARNFFLNDKGEWIPTKKGIAVELGNLSDFITLLEKAEAQVRKDE
jgi:hypothetical protein